MEELTMSPELEEIITCWMIYLRKLYCQPCLAQNGTIWVDYKGLSFIIRFKEDLTEFECLSMATLNLKQPLDQKSFYEAMSYLCYMPGPKLILHEGLEDGKQIVSGYYDLFNGFIFEEQYEIQNLTALKRILDSFLNLRMKLLIDMQIIKEEESGKN